MAFLRPRLISGLRWLLLPVIAFLLFFSPQPVRALDEGAEATVPAEIAVQLAVSDIPNVDELAETFDMDAYLFLGWTDPAAYEKLGITGGGYSSLSTGDALASLEAIGWSYIVMFSNQVGARDVLYATLSVSPEGEILYTEHFQATFRSKYNLKAYPFDSQNFHLRIESCEYDAEKAVFVPVEDKICFYESPDEAFEGRGQDLMLEEWDLDGDIITEAGTYTSVLSGRTWSYLTVDIGANRKAGFYMWKIFLPMILIIGVSWTVFWLWQEDVSSRLSISMIGFLTAISFGLFISSNLPEISYLTFMDAVITSVYTFMTLTVVEVLCSYFLVKNGKEAIAARMNLHSRWIFPLGFAATLVIVSAALF